MNYFYPIVIMNNFIVFCACVNIGHKLFYVLVHIPGNHHFNDLRCSIRCRNFCSLADGHARGRSGLIAVHHDLAPGASHHRLYIIFFKKCSWNLVDLQYCANFCCTANWPCDTHIYILSFIFFSIVIYHRMLSIVPCAVQ